MHFEKTMCDRLGYKYKEIFSHLDFILNKMNNLLNNYGCGLSDKELEILSQLFLKLETGQIEIIEFTKPIEKYLDVDEIYKENKQLKEENKELNQKYLNAVSDYETTMFEKEQLNSLVNSCQEEIRRLKKELEKVLNDYCRLDAYNRTQQKEFIEWLSYRIDYGTESISYRDSFREVLQKFKEIIGGKDETK